MKYSARRRRLLACAVILAFEIGIAQAMGDAAAKSAPAAKDTSMARPAADTSAAAGTYSDFLLGVPLPADPEKGASIPAAEPTPSPEPEPVSESGPGLAESPAAPGSAAASRMGFSGFFESRMHAHRYGSLPPWMEPDEAGAVLGARLGLNIHAAANAHLGARAAVTLSDDFSGRFLNPRAGKSPRRVMIPGVGEGPDTAFGDGTHHPDGTGPDGGGAGIFEDLLAEVEIRSRPIDAVVRAGTTLWIQGSPLTLWNRDPRPKAAWYYEEFEPEMSSSQYYETKAFTRGGDPGRHDWPKRAFAGLALETSRMPYGLGLQLDLMDPSAILPTGTGKEPDPQVTGSSSFPEAGGIGSGGSLYHVRALRRLAGSRHALALNILGASLPEDLINQRDFSAVPARGFVYQFRNGRQPFFVNPRVASLDAAGGFDPTLTYHGEVGFSMDDSVKYQAVPGTDSMYDGRSAVRHLRGPPAPAAFLRITSKSSVTFETEIFFASSRFWSPYSMAQGGLPYSRDAISLGAGALHSQGNLAGIGFKLSPSLSEGFLVVSASQHMQVAAADDMLRFQHVLNGREMWESSSSRSRRDPARMMDQGMPAGNPRHDARIGDLAASADDLYGGQQPGGLRGGDREVWEEFAAFETKAQADSGRAPRHRKFASTFSLDWGFLISPWLGAWRPMLINLYAEAGSLGTDWTAMANNGRTLLWSGKIRLEPALSLTPDFHVLGHLGLETWKSRHAWRNALANQAAAGQYNNRNAYDPLSSLSIQSQNAVPRVDAVKAPIDYLQQSFGLGCDWDFAPRAGLHLRIKHAGHRDAEIPANNWSGFFLFAGVRTWI